MADAQGNWADARRVLSPLYAAHARFLAPSLSLGPQPLAEPQAPAPPAHCPAPSPSTPPFHLHPRHPLSPLYPHIAETIVSLLPHADRLALRATCKALHHTVDSTFVRSLTLVPAPAARPSRPSTLPFLAPCGRVPIPDLTRRPELWPQVRALDFSALVGPFASAIDAACAALPLPSALPALRVVRSSAERANPRLETTRTVVRVFAHTPSNPGGRHTPWRLHVRPLPRCERLVLLLLYRHPFEVRTAQLSPRFWGIPASVREVVLHTRQLEAAPPGTGARWVDNGFEGWAGLTGLLRVLVRSGVRVVLVGVWERQWLPRCGDDEKEETFEAAWKRRCAELMVGEGVGEEEAEARMEARFAFVSAAAYRAQMGEAAWRVERAHTLAEVPEGDVDMYRR